MLNIVFLLTVLTANGPITAAAVTMGPFASSADCQAFGEAMTPLAEQAAQSLARSGGTGEIQPFYLEADDAQVSVSFRCAPADP